MTVCCGLQLCSTREGPGMWHTSHSAGHLFGFQPGNYPGPTRGVDRLRRGACQRQTIRWTPVRRIRAEWRRAVYRGDNKDHCSSTRAVASHTALKSGCRALQSWSGYAGSHTRGMVMWSSDQNKRSRDWCTWYSNKEAPRFSTSNKLSSTPCSLLDGYCSSCWSFVLFGPVSA